MSNKSDFPTPDKKDINDRLQDFVKTPPRRADVVKLDSNLGRKPSGEVTPEPSISLNLSFDTGEVPRGSAMRVYGEKHTSKALFYSDMIAKAQRCGIPVILVDTRANFINGEIESSINGELLAFAGVDIEDLNIIVPHDLETMAEIVHDFSDSGALIVIDSVVDFESEGKTRSTQYHFRQFTMWYCFLSSFKSKAERTGTTLVLIDRVRPNAQPVVKEESPEECNMEADIIIRDDEGNETFISLEVDVKQITTKRLDLKFLMH